MLDDTANAASKFRTRNWVKIYDESRGAYDYNSNIKFKISMVGSNLRDYSDAYIHVKAITTVQNTEAQGAGVNKKSNLKKNCALFNICISVINYTQVDDAQDTNIVMSMYNFITSYV